MTQFLCGYCETSFPNTLDLKSHLKKLHNGVKQKEVFKCDICEKSGFLTENYLKIHIKQYHKNDKPHRCDVCEKTFSSKPNLYRHLRIHQNKSLTCKHCKVTFTTTQSLEDHLLSHKTKPKAKVECKQCFKEVTYLKSHIARIHCDKKTWQCEICNKLFKSQTNLGKHLRNVHKRGRDSQRGIPTSVLRHTLLATNKQTNKQTNL